jgi:hypothetical protein
MKMLSRRAVLILWCALAGVSCRGTLPARDAQPPAQSKLATVTLAISGMT